MLARGLAGAQDVAAGLRRYEAERMGRAKKVVSMARRLGVIGQASRPWTCTLRDTLFGALPARLTERELVGSWRFS